MTGPRLSAARHATPGLELDLGTAMPGWVLRAGAGLLVLLAAVLTGGGTVLWSVAAVAAAAAVVVPPLPTTAVLPLLVGWWVLTGPDLLDDVGGVLRLAGLVLVVHLAVRVGALTRHVAWTARLEVAVVRRVVREVLRPQVAVQGLALVTFAVRALAGGATADALRFVAIPAVVVLVLLTVPRGWIRR